VVTHPEAPNASRLCAGNFEWIRWSANGDRLVVVREDGGGTDQDPQVAVIDAETGNVSALRDNQRQLVRGRLAQWVDGDLRLLYLRRDAADGHEVWSYEIASRNDRKVYPF
jgi:hypothetical protein